MKFDFIAEKVADKKFPVRAMCRVLGVSPSGYYAWRKRPKSERERRIVAPSEGVHQTGSTPIVIRGTVDVAGRHPEVVCFTELSRVYCLAETSPGRRPRGTNEAAQPGVVVFLPTTTMGTLVTSRTEPRDEEDPTTIAALDVGYRTAGALGAGVLFRGWRADRAVAEATVKAATVAEYVPGEFFQRELPILLSILKELPQEPNHIVVDGYVCLTHARTAESVRSSRRQISPIVSVPVRHSRTTSALNSGVNFRLGLRWPVFFFVRPIGVSLAHCRAI